MPESRWALAERGATQLRPRQRGAGHNPAQLGDTAICHPGLRFRTAEGEHGGVRVLPELEVDGRRHIQMRVLCVSEEIVFQVSRNGSDIALMKIF